MMRRLLVAILILIVAQTQAQSSDVRAEPLSMARPAVETGKTLLLETKGDLNRDGIEELVYILDTGKELSDEGLGSAREIQIFKQNNDAWQLWHRSEGAVLSSAHGGMMGDPLDGVSIVNNTLVIEHFGGSRDKWHYTHKYRFQNEDWYLIGATIAHFAPCDFNDSYDYNLSTGKLLVAEERFDINSDDCDSKGKSKHFALKRAHAPIKMDGFYPGDNEVALPKSSHYGSFYF